MGRVLECLDESLFVGEQGIAVKGVLFELVASFTNRPNFL
jgi:hypothetical protein